MSRAPIPAGFGHFAPVVVRLGGYRPCGSGLVFRCLFEARHKHGDRNWSGSMWVSDCGDLMAKCHGCGADRLDLMAEVGLPYSQWRNPAKRKVAARPLQPRERPVELGEPIAVYGYEDEHGQLLFQKCRFAPTPREKKPFRCRRPLDQRLNRQMGIPDGVSAWAWGVNEAEYGRAYRDGSWDLWPVKAEHQCSVKLPEVRRVLYGLPAVLIADPKQPVFLCEGEKDADNLRRLGFTATCTWAGSSSLDAHWLEPLVGRRVVVVADNDPVGRLHAMRQAGYLVCGGAKSVRVLWPGEHGFDTEEGGDISDWLDALEVGEEDWAAERQAVIDLCKKFPEYRS